MIKVTSFDVIVEVNGYKIKRVKRESRRPTLVNNEVVYTKYTGDILVNVAINNVIMFTNNVESEVSMLINL